MSSLFVDRGSPCSTRPTTPRRPPTPSSPPASLPLAAASCTLASSRSTPSSRPHRQSTSRPARSLLSRPPSPPRSLLRMPRSRQVTPPRRSPTSARDHHRPWSSRWATLPLRTPSQPPPRSSRSRCTVRSRLPTFDPSYPLASRLWSSSSRSLRPTPHGARSSSTSLARLPSRTTRPRLRYSLVCLDRSRMPLLLCRRLRVRRSARAEIGD